MEQSLKSEDVLVLASGGQDSTTCLVWAMENFRQVNAICFYYGQKHSVEMDAAETICRKFGVPLRVVDISFMKELVVSNLFQGTGDVGETHLYNSKVPASFVPYRNLLFLILASAWASTIGVRHIVIGVCETDYSGYADCRDVFIKSAQSTLNLSTDFADKGVILHTPLMWLTKAEEFRMAEELGCLDVVLSDTVTCYNGALTANYWGKGCGSCPACNNHSA